MKPELELVLDANRSSWAMSASHGTEQDRSSRTREFYERVTKRDEGVCRTCSWQSTRFQEIHPINGDHRSKDMDNWVTLCPLCHQVFHLPQTSNTGGGTLIWLPEISQAHLNLLSIPLFVAQRHPGHRYYPLAMTFNGNFSNRASYFKGRFYQDDPMLMAQIIVSMKPEQYAKRGEMLRHIRLWPKAERFESAIDHWEQHNFKNWKDTDWDKALPQDFDLSQVLTQEPAYG